jgi:hypothetical protein
MLECVYMRVSVKRSAVQACNVVQFELSVCVCAYLYSHVECLCAYTERKGIVGGPVDFNAFLKFNQKFAALNKDNQGLMTFADLQRFVCVCMWVC